MNRIFVILALLLHSLSALSTQSTYTTDSSFVVKKRQAIPPSTQSFGIEAFGNINYTSIRWLGSAGFFINSRGSTIMIDPMLKGFDMPLLIDMPIKAENVPQLDAVLITHCDNDHYSIPTCQILQSVCKKGFHSTNYVASLMNNSGMDATGYHIGDSLEIGSVRATLLFADHAWQNHIGKSSRKFNDDDFCGFWLETPDGTIWAPGDTRFYSGLLTMPENPDVIFFDFSDDPWHLGLENAIKLANTYPKANLLLSHWGTVDAPDMKPFNADPAQLNGKIINPERIHILAPGEEYILQARTNSNEPTAMNRISEKHKVRLSRIVVDPTQLKEYNAFLKEEIEASMQLEPGVLTLYATAEKKHPNRITILEIYANEEAYHSHIKTPHFIKYKEGTLDMVQELELIDTTPLIEGLKIK